jgi:hypothetical protein
MTNDPMYAPADNIYTMSVKNFIWGVIGIITGILINNFIILIGNTFKIRNVLIQNIIQMSVCALTLSLIYHYKNYYEWTWQNTTPGLFFVCFFFGAQFKIFNNVENTNIIKDNFIF